MNKLEVLRNINKKDDNMAETKALVKQNIFQKWKQNRILKKIEKAVAETGKLILGFEVAYKNKKYKIRGKYEN